MIRPLCLAISCLLPFAPALANTEPLTLGILAERPVAEETAHWQYLADYLNRALPDQRFNVLPLAYPELEQKLHNHDIDFVLTNPGHYIRLRQNYALSGELATLIEFVDRQPIRAIGGVIFALRQRNDINALSDLNNKTVASIGRPSLGGYQAQAYLLAQAGIDIDKDVRLVTTGMAHDDAVVAAVLSHTADAGFVRTGALEAKARSGRLKLADLKIINPQDLPGFPFAASTQLYPSWPFVALPHVGEELARQVAARLLMMGHERQAANSGHAYGFSIPADYAAVEDLLRALRLPPFDALPQFTWRDILLRYRYPLSLLAVAIGLIVLLAFLLFVKNRQLLQTKNRAKDGETKLATILDSLGAYVYIKDLRHRYVFANRQIAELFGVAPADIVGRGDDSFFTAATCENLKKLDQRVLEAGERMEMIETNTLSRSGEQRSFLAVKLPLRDSDNRIYALCGIATDITERKRIEDQLFASKQHFERLVEIIPIGVFETDSAGGCVFVNSRWSAISGIDPQQALGDGWRLGLHPEDRERVAHAWRQTIDENRAFELEYRFLTPTGQETWVLSLATSMSDSAGQITGYIGAITDISQAKRAALDLQQSNADLEQFAYAVSHDMRQPLRMVTSYLSLMEKRLTGELDDETRQYIAFAADGAKRMDQMILSLLEFSRIGRKTLPMAAVESRNVLDEALAFLGPEIDAHSAIVAITGDWPEIVASRDELSRLLQNLIGNAVKYHAENRIPHVEIVGIMLPDLFRVEVRDSGIGIAPEQTDRLFKVFSRLQARSRFEGTGVGLALCRKIVEHHGGKIGVDSAGEHQGSCFWFEIPCPTHLQTLRPAP